MSNCKSGDLAVIVRAHQPKNLGRVVQVIGPAAPGERAGGLRFDPKDEAGPFWRLRGTVEVSGHVLNEWFGADSPLKPLRPSDEPDEMLRIEDIPVADRITARRRANEEGRKALRRQREFLERSRA